jgi:hypothetical protein
LLPGVGSVVADDPVTVLTIVAPANVAATVACTVIVALEPGLSRPIAHDTAGAVTVHVPRLDAAELGVRPATPGSLTVTALASDGPLLVTTIV